MNSNYDSPHPVDQDSNKADFSQILTQIMEVMSKEFDHKVDEEVIEFVLGHVFFRS